MSKHTEEENDIEDVVLNCRKKRKSNSRNPLYEPNYSEGFTDGFLYQKQHLDKRYSRDDLKPLFEKLADDLENDYGRIELPSFAIAKWFNENYPESLTDKH